MTQPWTLDAPSPTRTRTWTPLLVTQLVVVLAVLLSGVTGAGVLRSRTAGGGDVLQVVQAASTSIQRQHTFRATYVFALQGSGIKVSVKGEMLVDTLRQVASGRVDVPSIGSVDVVASGTTGYLKIPGGKTDPAGNHWYGFTAPSASGAASAVGGQDPLAMLKLLGDPKTVRKVGAEKVNGVSTDHYSVALDPQRLADIVARSPSAASVPPGLLNQLKDSKIDVWVDKQNLPRRLRMSLKIQQVTANFTFDYRDFGGPVKVTVPDPRDVTTVSGPQQIGALIAGFATH